MAKPCAGPAPSGANTDWKTREHDHLEFGFVGFQEGGQVGTWSDHQAAAPLSCLLEVLPCQTTEWRFSLLDSRVPLVLRNGISRGRRLLEFACQITWGRERLEFRRRLTPGPSQPGQSQSAQTQGHDSCSILNLLWFLSISRFSK